MSRQRLPLRMKLWVLLLLALPWLLFGGVVLAGWWFLVFDGTEENNGLGVVLLGLSLPVLFVAVPLSRWERRQLKARFNLEATAADGRGGGGGFSDLIDW